jgi:hypothetical protein
MPRIPSKRRSRKAWVAEEVIVKEVNVADRQPIDLGPAQRRPFAYRNVGSPE